MHTMNTGEQCALADGHPGRHRSAESITRELEALWAREEALTEWLEPTYEDFHKHWDYETACTFGLGDRWLESAETERLERRLRLVEEA